MCGDLRAERNAVGETELLLFGMGTRTPLRTGLETICATFLWWELFQPLRHQPTLGIHDTIKADEKHYQLSLLLDLAPVPSAQRGLWIAILTEFIPK